MINEMILILNCEFSISRWCCSSFGIVWCCICISQLIRFARVPSHVDDFNTRNKVLTAKLLRQEHIEQNDGRSDFRLNNGTILYLT